jgi:hypothetical protein
MPSLGATRVFNPAAELTQSANECAAVPAYHMGFVLAFSGEYD